MVTYLPRSEWKARASRGGASLVPSEVLNTAFHWPGMSKPINAVGEAGKARVASALRGWQNYHMDGHGWSDIAYQVAIDQEGRAWTLRGINIRSGANGDANVNRKYGAVLLVLGPGEKPTAKMTATAKAVVADYRKRFTKMPVKPTTHSAVRPAGTDCPGDEARAMISAGKFNAAAPTPTTSTGDLMATLDSIQTAVNGLRTEESKRYVTYSNRYTDMVERFGALHKRLDAIDEALADVKNRLIRIEDDTDDGTAAPKA